MKKDILQNWLTANEFCKLGIISESTFYKKAPKGEIPGAFQVGKKWFVDLEEFKSAFKPNKAA